MIYLMLGIEILVVDPRYLIDLSKYPFLVDATTPPCSYRDPTLWEDDLVERGGILYHLGNPKLEDNCEKAEWFTAYDLLDHDHCWEYFDEYQSYFLWLKIKKEFENDF